MKIIADLHTHSLASSHAYSTISEMCEQAAKAGLKALAITDHGPELPDAPHLWHFHNMRTLPRFVHGVYLLRGTEANILDTSATLDLGVNRLDFVVASMHLETFVPSTKDAHTAAWLAACDNPHIDCLGHMGRPQYDFDHEAVIKRCAQTGTLIEINNASKRARKGSYENCLALARLCKAYGVALVVTTDAHCCWQVGDFSESLSQLAEVDFPEELVMNADWDRFRAYFKERKGLEIPS